MVLVKTPAGQEALKDRHGSLSSRQRSAFILFDGKRTTGEILAATAAMGITQDDVQSMIAQGLLAPVGGHTSAAAVTPVASSAAPAAPVAAALAEAPATDLGTVASPLEGSGRSPMERYQAAYPIATELTAALGLRGFRLNLAVEGAGSFEDLAALAPKIREAVGDAKFERLDKALFD
ncbi:hypothetical protein [Acidovorax sp.]|jgi:hypothetical protein|uniref:hypothetical protein n=1 Tax=Acidovorax sp. TaxID=1872122 RepID=UPI0025C25D76|nr:hypothetical protein [Acidovorax sp.]MBL7088219.1 hypothetical protein [Acidovorax sp.]